MAAAGNVETVNLTLPANVNWTAASNDGWIVIPNDYKSGVGSAAISLNVVANPSVLDRSGTVTIAGKTINVYQKGLASSLEYDNKLIGTDGGSGNVSVYTEGNAAWTAVSDVLSYALGSQTLIEKVPEDGDLTVEKFEPKSGEDGKFDFTVSVKDVDVGGAAQTEAQKAEVKENLKQVFGLEGGTSLEPGGMSSANVDITFGTPADGKVKFTAGPNAKNADAKTFFMKVKITP